MIILLKKILHAVLALQYLGSILFRLERKKEHRVVFFDHFYGQDVKAMELAFARVGENSLTIDTSRLFRGAYLYFEEAVRGLNAPYGLSVAGGGRFYSIFIKVIFYLLKYRLNLKVLILPSDNYYWIRAFIETCMSAGISVVVVDKEGLISPYDFDAECARIRRFAPFMSDHIYVWSERQKVYWTKAGVEESRITVIGQPRSDLLFLDPFVKKSVRPKITFFTFDDIAYIPPEFVSAGCSWNNLKNEAHGVLKEFANNHPEIDVVVKAHPQQQDLNNLTLQLSGENLTVLGGSQTSCSLIQESQLVVAFQTTALLEAIMIGKPVIYIDWAKTSDKLKELLLPFSNCPGTLSCRTVNQFRGYLDKFADNTLKAEIPQDREKVKSFVDDYFKNCDGKVSDRLVSDIRINFLD
jgi:hypothetical protein